MQHSSQASLIQNMYLEIFYLLRVTNITLLIHTIMVTVYRCECTKHIKNVEIFSIKIHI